MDSKDFLLDCRKRRFASERELIEALTDIYGDRIQFDIDSFFKSVKNTKKDLRTIRREAKEYLRDRVVNGRYWKAVHRVTFDLKETYETSQDCKKVVSLERVGALMDFMASLEPTDRIDMVVGEFDVEVSRVAYLPTSPEFDSEALSVAVNIVSEKVKKYRAKKKAKGKAKEREKKKMKALVKKLKRYPDLLKESD